VHILFATAEMQPIVSTGGLGAASAGLIAALRRAGHDVDVVLPDYAGSAHAGNALPGRRLGGEERIDLDVPGWVGSARVRVGDHAVAGRVHLLHVPSIERSHPYVDPETGHGWSDNDHRFFGWSCAVAALARRGRPDVVHVNDWHAATVLGHLDEGQRSVLSIHNLAHQGWADAGWEPLLGRRSAPYVKDGAVNALAGAIAIADRVVTVSPSYADEIRTPANGHGLHQELLARGDALVGILNGIDTDDWDPETDPALSANYAVPAASDPGIGAKVDNQRTVGAALGLPSGPGPLIVSVSRLDHQKGIDLLLELARIMPGLPARLALLGSGDHGLEGWARAVADRMPESVAFRHGYDDRFAHQLFGAGDLTVIPSRFEPCGLTQMQAMRYGTLPIVTDVGGLRDTVVDADARPRAATGIVAHGVDPVSLADALHRGVRLWDNRRRRTAAIRRGMSVDWSWETPARRYEQLYESLFVRPAGPA